LQRKADCFGLMTRRTCNVFLVHVPVPQLLSVRVQTPVKTEVTKDRFYLLTEMRALRVPSPFSNHGNFVVRQESLARRKLRTVVPSCLLPSSFDLVVCCGSKDALPSTYQRLCSKSCLQLLPYISRSRQLSLLSLCILVSESVGKKLVISLTLFEEAAESALLLEASREHP
jgi:hypothetical protein